MFVNTLSADGNYHVQSCGNFQLPTQMQLCEKQKNFSQFSVLFLEATSTFKHFEKKDDGLSYCIFKITDSEKLRHTTL